MPLGTFSDIKKDGCSGLLGIVMPPVHRTGSGWSGSLSGDNSPETFLDQEHLHLRLPDVVVAAIEDRDQAVARKGRHWIVGEIKRRSDKKVKMSGLSASPGS